MMDSLKASLDSDHHRMLALHFLGRVSSLECRPAHEQLDYG